MGSARVQRWGVGVLVGVLVGFALWAVGEPLRGHGACGSWMYFAQDDFFYYLKVAQNVAAWRGSTFNGLVATNGYHPLWMLMLAGVLRLGVGEHGLVVFLAATVWAATMATFALSWMLLRRSGVAELAAAVGAVWVAVYGFHLFAACMEVTLTVPLMLAVLVAVQRMEAWSGSAGRCALVGLLAAAMVLSRLDAAIFVGLLVCAVLAQAEMRALVLRREMAWLGVGLLPVAVYGWSNERFFGVWLPVSGMAKQMKLHAGFSATVWRTLPERFTGMQRGVAVAVVVALVALPWVWRRMAAAERAVAVAALGFPVVYLVALSWLSDWPVWGWYFYGLRAAMAVAVMVLWRSVRVQRAVVWAPVLVLLVSVTLVRVVQMRWDQQSHALVDAAVDLQGFAATHPGVYAMGDRAGTVGYLLREPLVQTEGLMMDRGFLRLIAAQTPLRAALGQYDVRYYVGTATRPFAGCFVASEPAQAGPDAPHMRAEFCAPPVARWRHEGVETVVFDLKAGSRE